jgi:hypothetical protein
MRKTNDVDKYVGSAGALKLGSVHAELTSNLVAIGARPRSGQSEIGSDILERYRTVPLHAIFLYTSEDKEVGQYILEHWGALDALSGDYCDLHPSVDQFHSAEDAYDFVEQLDVVREARSFSLSHLPGVFFWDGHANAEYISFGDDLSTARIRHVMRVVFDEIRMKPNIMSVRHAKARLASEAGRTVRSTEPIWKDLAPFVAGFVVLLGAVALASRWISPLTLGIVLIASVLAFVLVGVFALRHREQLSERNLLIVIGQVLSKLPLLRKAVADISQKKESLGPGGPPGGSPPA